MYSKRMQHKWAQQKNIYRNGIDWNKLMYKTNLLSSFKFCDTKYVAETNGCHKEVADSRDLTKVHLVNYK